MPGVQIQCDGCGVIADFDASDPLLFVAQQVALRRAAEAGWRLGSVAPHRSPFDGPHICPVCLERAAHE